MVMDLEREIKVKRIGIVVIIFILAAFPVYVLFLEGFIQSTFSGDGKSAVPTPQIVESPIIEEQSTTPTQIATPEQAPIQTPPRTETLLPRTEREPERQVTRQAQTPPARAQVSTPRRQEVQTPVETPIQRQPMPMISGERALFFTSTAINSENIKEYHLQNTGDGDLQIGTIRITGSDAGSFALGSSPTLRIPPGGSEILTIIFNPTETGAKRAILQIDHNDQRENTFTVELIGSAISENITQNN
jgi:hypothetical protein